MNPAQPITRQMLNRIVVAILDRIRETFVWPRAFTSEVNERDFLTLYRTAGLTFAGLGSFAGAIAFLVLALEAFISGHQGAALNEQRLWMAAILAAVACLTLAGHKFTLSHFTLITTSAISMTFVMCMFAIFQKYGIIYVLPGLMFALFIQYAFVRIPVHFSVALNAGGSLMFAVAGGMTEQFTNTDFSQGRLNVYLLLMNAVGATLAASMEVRERKLFLANIRAKALAAEAEGHAAKMTQRYQEEQRMLQSVSHEMQQPMTAAAIRLEAARISVLRDPEESIHDIDAAAASIAALDATVRSVLELAQMEAQNTHLHLEPTALVSFIASYVKHYNITNKHTDQAVILETDGNHPHALVDATALRRVLQNLLSNAQKYWAPQVSGDPCRIVVRVEQCDRRVLVSVEDNGPGIPLEFQNAIFDSYFRIQRDDMPQTQGLGIGLRLVKGLVERSPGHQLNVASTIGLGTAFRISMPLCEAPEALWGSDNIPENLTAQLSPSAESIDSTIVLLVEDDRDVRQALTQLFGTYGVLVYEAHSIDSVPDDVFDTDRGIDVIISDYSLPGSENGLEVIRSVRERLQRHVPAMLISGNQDTSSILSDLDTTITFLGKPFSATMICDWIRKEMSQHEHERTE